MAKQRECHAAFDGKVIVSSGNPGELMYIESVRMDTQASPLQIVTLQNKDDAGKFAPGGSYAIYDIAPGDTWYVCGIEK